MKTLKFLYLLAIVMCAFSSAFSAGTTVFDGTGGLTDWQFIGSGTTYDADNGGALSTFLELAALTSPANTMDYGVDGGTWGWDAAMISPTGHVNPSSGSYVGVRYEAVAGEAITEVNIPKIYTNVDTSMHLQIVDADGAVMAELTPAAPTSLNSLSVTGLYTPAVEIRWVNTAPSTIHLWGTANGIIFNTVEVTSVEDPNYVAYSPVTFDNPNKPLTWFGYYHAYTVPAVWGDAFPTVGSYTNLNHVFPKQGAISSAIANHSYMLVDVMWWLFESSGDGYALRNDWETQVASLATMFAGYEDYIGAFSPLDEPYHRSVTQAHLETAIAGLKEAFPGIPIYVNFAPTIVYDLTTATLPAGADWLAFDLYASDSNQPVQIADIQLFVDHLKNIKSAEQKLFLVPPSAMNLQATYTDQQLADTINAFYNLMQNDDEIIGMVVFAADGCRQAEFDGIGTTIPLALAAQQAIGAEIAGEVCGDIWNGFYKFDYNRDCLINFIDWAEYANKWANE